MLIQDQSLEIVQSTAMDAILQSELDAKKEREKALDYWEHTSTDQYINRYFRGDSLSQVPIFTSGLTRRVVSAACQVYRKMPNYDTDPKYIEMSGDLWRKMRLLEQMTFLLGTVGLITSYNEQKQKLEHDLLLFFEPMFLPGSDKPFGCVYQTETQGSTAADQNNHRYVVWTEGTMAQPGLHFSFDRNGNVYAPHNNPKMENPYGDMIPITWAHRYQPLRDWGGGTGAMDIVNANQQLDLALTELSLALRFGAIGIRYVTGVDSDELISVGPDKILVLPEQATMGSLGPNVSLNELIEASKWMVTQAMHNNNIRLRWNDEKGNSPSGESLRVQEISNQEDKEASKEMVWRPFEHDRYEVDRRVLEVKAGITLGDSMSVDFIEPDIYLSPTESREEWQFKWDNGLATKKDWFKQTYGNDYPDEKIEAKMEEAANEAAEPVAEEENPLLAQLAAPVNG